MNNHWNQPRIDEKGNKFLNYNEFTIVEWSDGWTYYSKKNKDHRDDGPAIITPTSQEWFIEGIRQMIHAA
jgi:hypothetical protein